MQAITGGTEDLVINEIISIPFEFNEFDTYHLISALLLGKRSRRLAAVGGCLRVSRQVKQVIPRCGLETGNFL